MSVKQYSAQVENLVSRGRSGALNGLKEDADRLLSEIKKAIRSCDKTQKTQLDRLQRTVTDFMKDMKQVHGSAFSNQQVRASEFQGSSAAAVSCGSGSRGLSLEATTGPWHGQEMLTESLELEHKLAVHQAREVDLRKIQNETQELHGCWQEVGKLIAQQSETLNHIEEDVGHAATRIPRGTTEIAAAGKAKAGRRKMEGAAVAGVLGAAIGIVAGPVGVVAGGAAGAGLGGYLGHSIGQSEKRDIDQGLRNLEHR